MIDKWLVILTSTVYVAVLFLITFYADKIREKSRHWVNNAYTYALSLAVYCTAWTYYGSIGKAANEGITFLAVYTGPILMAPLMLLILRRMIRICKMLQITTIADFISSRYGKNKSIGILVTCFSFIGIIPYISLQLKAVSDSFSIITAKAVNAVFGFGIFEDTAFYVALVMMIFALVFGTRKLDTSERHQGIVAAIAFESVIKLVAVFAVGIFVCFSIFDSPVAIFKVANTLPELKKIFTIDSVLAHSDWLGISILSFLVILLLPRQFQMGVVENTNENHLKKAMWLFPLYLLLINLFVIPIAFGAKIHLSNLNPDYFILDLPMNFNKPWLGLFVFIGGLSASSSMIIVETIALGIMFSNSLFLPLFLRPAEVDRKIAKTTLNVRRFSIVFIIALAYIYYAYISNKLSLVSIGLISFVSVAQFAPAVFGGMFWVDGNKNGAVAGMVVGFIIWFYTLIFPTLIRDTSWGMEIINQGLFHISAFKPEQLGGISSMNKIPLALFWSLLSNTFLYILISLISTPKQIERNQAEIFININKYYTEVDDSVVTKGKTGLLDLTRLLGNFIGYDRAHLMLNNHAKRYNIELNKEEFAPAKIVAYCERLLSGIVGSVSARTMIAAITKNEEHLQLEEVMVILKESQNFIAINKELARKSTELEQALEKLKTVNSLLLETDKMKDDFLTTVTHELKTPLTSIRSFAEILLDEPDLDAEQKKQFLTIVVNESDRVTRLISQVLDLEKYESGKQILHSAPNNIKTVFDESISYLQLHEGKHLPKITLTNNLKNNVFEFDRDKILQVVLNLLSNALKFVDSSNGVIAIELEENNDNILITIRDNGKGIDAESQKYIFDKFFQATNQNEKKPMGSGLGLTISKKIIELHQGNISLHSVINEHTTFNISLPKTTT